MVFGWTSFTQTPNLCQQLVQTKRAAFCLICHCPSVFLTVGVGRTANGCKARLPEQQSRNPFRFPPALGETGREQIPMVVATQQRWRRVKEMAPDSTHQCAENWNIISIPFKHKKSFSSCHIPNPARHSPGESALSHGVGLGGLQRFL